ncbi:MAG: sigma-70 family RNA polymerase sigma factor [Microvirga sp.]
MGERPPVTQSLQIQAPGLPEAIRTHLFRQLKDSYSEVIAEVLPPRFLELIRALEDTPRPRSAVEPWFKDELMNALPNLRAFAISLSGSPDHASDLVQETILRAWNKHESFQRGTIMKAWLFTILRNTFHTHYRKRSREVEDPDGHYVGALRVAPDQLDKLCLQDLQHALGHLAPDQREALLLVSAEGLSYEETAAICGCALGTIKSRVNRARTRLAELMDISDDDLVSDGVLQAALVAD